MFFFTQKLFLFLELSLNKLHSNNSGYFILVISIICTFLSFLIKIYFEFGFKTYAFQLHFSHLKLKNISIPKLTTSKNKINKFMNKNFGKKVHAN